MSKIYYAYTRVSDARQGEGVSLKQQLDAIERYASKQGLKIVEHFRTEDRRQARTTDFLENASAIESWKSFRRADAQD